MLIAPAPQQATATLTARDEFQSPGGILGGRTMNAGGTWTTSGGDTDDFNVNVSLAEGVCERTHIADTGTNILGGGGRLALAGSTNFTNVAIEMDVMTTGTTGLHSHHARLVARYVDASNAFVMAAIFSPDNGSGGITLYSWLWVAGLLGASERFHEPGYPERRPGFAPNVWYRFRLAVMETGYVHVWWVPKGYPFREPVWTFYDSSLATGGVLASGRSGFMDSSFAASAAVTRSYNNFVAYAPNPEVVMYPSQSCQISTDGFYREDSAGTGAWAPLPGSYGDIPRIPVAGTEGRTTQTFLKTSRGDFGTFADGAIDNISARLFYRPCWLTVPGT